MASNYEGRIRPSLIAALPRPASVGLPGRLRGANSPLPHCGSRTRARLTTRLIATRGEFAPPSLRRGGRRGGLRKEPATRGEFAPPSLRREVLVGDGRAEHAYEGRIRPSLIAARAGRYHGPAVRDYEGRIRPSLIAARRGRRSTPRLLSTRGEFAPPSLRRGNTGRGPHGFALRGANSPLPHCGPAEWLDECEVGEATRGEFAPPSLRL